MAASTTQSQSITNLSFYVVKEGGSNVLRGGNYEGYSLTPATVDYVEYSFNLHFNDFVGNTSISITKIEAFSTSSGGTAVLTSTSNSTSGHGSTFPFNIPNNGNAIEVTIYAPAALNTGNLWFEVTGSYPALNGTSIAFPLLGILNGKVLP